MFLPAPLADAMVLGVTGKFYRCWGNGIGEQGGRGLRLCCQRSLTDEQRSSSLSNPHPTPLTPAPPFHIPSNELYWYESPQTILLMQLHKIVI